MSQNKHDLNVDRVHQNVSTMQLFALRALESMLRTRERNRELRATFLRRSRWQGGSRASRGRRPDVTMTLYRDSAAWRDLTRPSPGDRPNCCSEH